MSETAWVGLGGILATVVVALSGPHIAGRVQVRTAKATALFEARRDLYVRLLTLLFGIREQTQDIATFPTMEQSHPEKHDLWAMDAEVRLLAGAVVVGRFEAVVTLLAGYWPEVFRAQLATERARQREEMEGPDTVGWRLRLGEHADQIATAIGQLQEALREEITATGATETHRRHQRRTSAGR